MSRSEIITAKDVLNITNGGEDIFKREIGEISYTRNVKSPFRKDDNPSFKLKRNSKNEVVGQDYGGNQWFGGAISLIQDLYGLSFTQAINRIWKDFNGNSTSLVKKQIQNDYSPKKKQSLIYEFNDCRFTDNHKHYMDKIFLDENYCNSRDIWAVDKWAINKKIQKKTEGEYNFAYVPKDEKGNEIKGKLKILSLGPNVLKQNKWRTCWENKSLWHLHTIPKDCENLFVVKSVKDGAVLNKHYNLHCIELQSENANVFLQNNVEKVKSLAKNIIIALGTDPQAKQTSITITKETGFKWFNVPNNVYDNYGISDFAEYIEQFGIKSLANLLKIKNYL